jgi:hypothetical protein
MEEFRLDRTAFFAGTHEEVERQANKEDAQLTPTERLRVAAYLNSVAFGHDLQNPPRLDRTVFSVHKRS